MLSQIHKRNREKFENKFTVKDELGRPSLSHFTLNEKGDDNYTESEDTKNARKILEHQKESSLALIDGIVEMVENEKAIPEMGLGSREADLAIRARNLTIDDILSLLLAQREIIEKQ